MRKGKTMSDYISREAVTNELEKHKYSRDYCVLHNIDWAIDFGMAMASVDSIPSADVRPNIHGYWRTESQKELSYCSECGFTKWVDDIRLYKFCPNCGLKMDREEPEEIIGIGNADKMGKLVDNLIKAMDGEPKGEKGETC